MVGGELQDREASEHDDLESYRTLTPWAIVSLIFGLLSGLASLTPILWILPLAAVISGALALRSIRVHAPRLLGRNLALGGLALGLIFGVSGPARILSRNYWLESRAIQAADEWLAFISHGEPEKAYMVTQAYSQRQPLDASLAHYLHVDAETQRQYDEYLSRPDIKTLMDARDSIRVTSRHAITQDSEGRADVVLCQYEVQFQREQKTMQITLFVSVERTLDLTGAPAFRIRNGDYVAAHPVPARSP